MKNKSFNVIIEKGEDGYFISDVVGLPGCHTQAKNIDDLLKRTKEAISLYIKSNGKISKLDTKFVGIQRVEVAA